jgi:hypothetical protein|tara:strand:- start:6 stop:140 length:135 start_codon:yes stop_codon:yes gene_type:complete
MGTSFPANFADQYQKIKAEKRKTNESPQMMKNVTKYEAFMPNFK